MKYKFIVYNYSCSIALLLFTLRTMSLYIASLNSGSNGNCYYIGNKNDAILVDAGISCRSVERRLKQLNIPISRIRAIFISHEHIDHIKGVEALSKKLKLPVYISEKTLACSGLQLNAGSVCHFVHGDEVSIGELKIHAFSKIHDAGDPFSFCVIEGDIHVGVFTDIGTCCGNVTDWFSKCHAAFLESNYDEAMLDDGPYPYYLKRRIAGGRGHLSNAIAHRLFCEHRPDYMSHLILSHLSNNNNAPEIVEELFKSNCGSVEIIVASRSEATPLFEINGDLYSKPAPVQWKQTVISFG